LIHLIDQIDHMFTMTDLLFPSQDAMI